MTYNVIRSDDTGAPSLTGQAGTFITLLDAVLVNGFNTKTITITRSGTTATATCTAHGYRNYQNLTISGANESDYNGTFVISNVTANTFDYTVANSPATPATGTISAKVSPLGWTKPYTGTNLAAFRMGAAVGSGPQGYIRIDDTTTSTCRYYCHGTMSDINTGTDRFPTNAQLSGGLYFYKSNSADATIRPWIIWGNEKLFFIQSWGLWSGATLTANNTGFDTATTQGSIAFGAYKSYVPSDAYNLFYIGANANSTGILHGVSGMNVTTPTGSLNIMLMRDYQAIGPRASGIHFPFSGVRPGGAHSFWPSFPSAVTGKVAYNPDTWILDYESTSTKWSVRGYIPGMTRPWADLISGTRRYWDTFTDSTTGAIYLVVPSHNGGGTGENGCLLVRLDAPESCWSLLT